jgi:vacuolar-type H+-ATPase subunit C/Vma6
MKVTVTITQSGVQKISEDEKDAVKMEYKHDRFHSSFSIHAMNYERESKKNSSQNFYQNFVDFHNIMFCQNKIQLYGVSPLFTPDYNGSK